MNWEDFRYFLTVAETGSFSAAARKLSVDHSTVARRVGQLEKDLCVRLIDRLPKAVMLTVEGKQIADQGQRALNEMLSVERLTAAMGDTVSGTVCISVPPAIANIMIAPHLGDLRQEHPGIELVLLGEASFSALDKRQADIALRLSRPTHQDLITRKIGNLPFGVYAAKGYSKPESEWEFINWDDTNSEIPQYAWLEKHLGQRSVSLRANDISIQAEAAATGIGVALLPCYVGDHHPMLSRLRETESFPPREVWMLVHSDIRKAPRVRAVMNFLISVVGRHLLDRE